MPAVYAAPLSSPPSQVKKLFAAALLSASALLSAPAALAQAAPNFPTAPATPDAPAATPPGRQASGDPARTRRREQMSPEEAQHDQQMEVLEARTGNTSFGAQRGGPARQLDKGNGGFAVRKFKDERKGYEQKRGMSRPVPGATPKGNRLIDHKPRKKWYLLF